MGVLHRIAARSTHAGALPVRRLLPVRTCRKVGPWVFVDHFGPTEAVASRDHDVRPHPHCGLSTVTFLFAGEQVHRDSLGSHARVRPGEIHWMRAGHGIVHSERAPEDRLGSVVRSHGLQLWCAHPDGEEEQAPAFGSWTELPRLELDGAAVDLLAGDGWGHASPVAVTSRLVYAIAHLRAGQRLALPDHEERCVAAVSGRVAVDGEAAGANELLVVDRAARGLVAAEDAVVAILGGDAIGPRHIWWNLVHSDRGRLVEQAERWRRGEFPTILDDADEVLPAPPGP